jgi:hypothetical protein|tara:strand:+ start:291 stop:491 length:201 start_codon:yes stop_codon:yes gene_type:complete
MKIRMNIALDTDDENDRNILAILDSTNLLSMISRVGDEEDMYPEDFFQDLEGKIDDTGSESKETSS